MHLAEFELQLSGEYQQARVERLDVNPEIQLEQSAAVLPTSPDRSKGIHKGLKNDGEYYERNLI
jgi:hypothetical protein